MKKLPARGEGLLGVVELDGSGKPWLAPTDKRVRNSSPIADLGGAEPGQLVLAEPRPHAALGRQGDRSARRSARAAGPSA